MRREASSLLSRVQPVARVVRGNQARRGPRAQRHLVLCSPALLRALAGFPAADAMAVQRVRC